ncbi:hypothetical protein CVT24_009320 [Panaeolus cyanescens]|uniref:C2 domain-containing protein n=1 Tax=Panaeolus cyanescens TaxID=181874 RepID=A0A409Y7X7_9AGAR|nr:hypothetical protein CVT24_009320 [Panaeolus cyanescens]
MAEQGVPALADKETHLAHKGAGPTFDSQQVIDPITHLPITIHDADKVELEQIPPPPTLQQEKDLRRKRGADTAEATQAQHAGMEDLVNELVKDRWWEDPGGDQRRAKVQTSIVTAGAAALAAFGGLILWFFFGRVFGSGKGVSWVTIMLTPFACCLLGLGVGSAGLILDAFQRKRPVDFLEHSTVSKSGNQVDESHPENAEWLNAVLDNIWPIINPALFTPIADMLEDTMQSTMPKFVNGVRVADLGQGSQSVRILGIRWLDAGSAGKDVEGMKAEEGDFFNLELAVAYRAKESTSTGMRGRSANAHILMEFFLSGGVVVPVWVELTGLLANARCRFQTTPNPPFLSLLTLTLLGQPKVTFKCTPLAKNLLNVMDVPGLSNWIESSVKQGIEAYIAPHSLSLDLKTLLMGRPKMDTDALGVLLITVKSATDFKEPDSVKLIKTNGETSSGNVYVSIGWSKWGKPQWSTRIINSSRPVWAESTALLVHASEIQGEEDLHLQLWDSDKFTADDLIGSVKVPLKELISSKRSHNCIEGRSDRLMSDRGDQVPGTLHWECGYFAKTTLDQHLQQKKKNADELRKSIEEEAEHKLREARAGGDEKKGEVEQQKKEDLKEKSDEIIAHSRPTAHWPSGILSIRIEQISDLEIQDVRQSGVEDSTVDDEARDLPSAYCTIIVNQQKVYKTRTKMKSGNPYYDAGTERFIRDWVSTDVIISVRDSRQHESDPVIGVVVLPLRELFRNSSMFMGTIPLVGGIGYGRMRLALLFRSVQMKLPRTLLGWDIGTLEVHSPAKPSVGLPPELASCTLVFRTMYGKGKLVSDKSIGGWSMRSKKPVRLAVKKRYSSCMVVEFRKHVVGRDTTPAFGILWLQDIPDDQQMTISLPIRRNQNSALAQARSNASSQIGEEIGHLELTIQFWAGLSGYHKHLAKQDYNMGDVMEVLDYAQGSQSLSKDILDAQDHEEFSDETSSSSSETVVTDEQSFDQRPKLDPEDEGTQETGLKGSFAQKVTHQKELHRKHRGLLQWKGMRNVAWMGKGVEHTAEKVGDKVKGVFKHQHDDSTHIEKEV